MSDAPRVSVVIPAFNAARTIASTIGSVLNQTESAFEVIVVDDGSTDTTRQIVAGLVDPRIRYMSQPNRGQSAALNAGIELATGAYVAFLDSDDLYLPRYLELALHALESTREAGFAYTDAYVFDDVSGKVRQRSAMARNTPPVPPPCEAEPFLLELLRRNFVYGETTVPKAVLERVGGFDESLGGSMDYELWLRILVHGYRPAWIQGRHILYRRHSAQFSRNLAAMSRSMSAVYDRVRMEELPSAAHRELLTRRRRESARELNMMSRFGRMIPLNLVTAVKRAGIGESWYDPPPAEVVAAFPDLAAV